MMWLLTDQIKSPCTYIATEMVVMAGVATG